MSVGDAKLVSTVISYKDGQYLWRIPGQGFACRVRRNGFERPAGTLSEFSSWGLTAEGGSAGYHRAGRQIFIQPFLIRSAGSKSGTSMAAPTSRALGVLRRTSKNNTAIFRAKCATSWSKTCS